MNTDTIILSMTTWPPRYNSALEAMKRIIVQREEDRLTHDVHCVLVLSREECDANELKAQGIISYMEWLDVEVIIDDGNIKSHKKLIPTLEKYPDNPILVVDDDALQLKHWLRTFVDDHRRHPDEIIYGMACSRVVIENGRIKEEAGNTQHVVSLPGQRSTDLKPANGASGTLYPAHTFTDPRFFDRRLFMRLSPTSDETWQFAFAKMAHRKFRCLSAYNYPLVTDADQTVALYRLNKDIYSDTHNAIAAEFPEYYQSLK